MTDPTNIATYKPTLKAGWTMPTPPAPDLLPVVYLDGEDSYTYWATQQQIDDGEYWSPPGSASPVEIPWPFSDTDGRGGWATAADMRAVGFVVVA